MSANGEAAKREAVDTVAIEIDGRPLEVRKGSMVIEAADAAGIAIPRFCYHRKLSVAANCRMCLVEVERAPKPLPACATPVMDGMKVATLSDTARQAQRSVMEFLLINHPLDCPICDQGGECELQDLAMGYGRGVSRFTEGKRVVPDKDLGPLIATDMTRCIHCTRCVRFGAEVAGLPELGATGRGEDMRIGTFIERSVDSELSGNVIDVCPVGALTSKPFRFRARAWEMVQREGVAAHDAVGSNVYVHVHRGRAMRVAPRENEAVNEVWLSDRDRFSYEGLYAADRLLRPRVRSEDGGWRETDWETALDAAAGQLRAVVGADGGAAGLGALASPAATTEEHYLLQALVRALGGANLDHRLRQADFRDEDEAPAWPWLGMELADLERVDAVLLVGSNVRKEQPLAGLRLRKAVLAGAAVFALNPIDHPFHFDLAGRIVVSPARLVDELAGIALALGGMGVAEDVPEASRGRKRERIGAAASGIERAFGGPGGVAPAAMHREVAARLAAAKRPAVLLGSGASAHPEAARLRALARVIARLWKWRRGQEADAFDPGEEGARVGYLSDGPNAAGAALAGMLPHRGPGGAPAPVRGLDAAAMLAAGLPAYLLLGTEPELDCADSGAALAALRGARSVVALTGYTSPAMEEYASVLLPIGLFTETPGTFYNAEGRRQRYEAATAPPGEARPAWRILRVLANRLALDGFDHETIGDVRAEADARIGGVSPPDPLAGPDVDRIAPAEPVPGVGAGLEAGGGSGGPGTRSAADGVPEGAAGAHEEAHAAGGTRGGGSATLWRAGEVPLYAVDPLVRRAPALQRTVDVPPPAVRVNPAAARVLGLAPGGLATIRQNGASRTLEVAEDPTVPDGCALLHAGVAHTVGLGPAWGPITIAPADPS